MLVGVSSPLRNFALPGVALLALAAYWLWRSSATAPAPLAPSSGKAAVEVPSTSDRTTSSAADRTGAQPAAPSPSKPTTTTTAEEIRRTRRDRAASDALRLALRERQRAGGSGRGSAAANDLEDDTAEPGKLDKDYIQARIKEDLVPIAKECYESALEDDPKLGGKLIMKFSIVGDEEVGGVVDEADIDSSSDIKHPALTECMRESMLSLSFAPPEDGGTVQVTYPFVFASDEP